MSNIAIWRGGRFAPFDPPGGRGPPGRSTSACAPWPAAVAPSAPRQRLRPVGRRARPTTVTVRRSGAGGRGAEPPTARSGGARVFRGVEGGAEPPLASPSVLHWVGWLKHLSPHRRCGTRTRPPAPRDPAVTTRAVLRDCLIARRQHVPERPRRRDEIPVFGIATSSPASLSQPRASPATPKGEPVTGTANVPYGPV